MATNTNTRHLGILAACAALGATFAPVPARADGPYYYIVNTRTKMMAEVLAHRTNDGAAVVLWPHYGGTSQQFQLEALPTRPDQPEEKLWYLLRARHSGKCLKTNGYQSGAPVIQGGCSASAPGMWRVRTVSMTPQECPSGRCFGGTRKILQNYYDNGKRCLDAANGKFPAPPAQGTGLQAWDCIGKYSAANAVNQEWELISVKDWDAPGPVVR